MSVIAIDIDETLYSFDSAIRSEFFDMAEERNDKRILRLAYSNNFEWRNLVDHDKSIAYEAIERVHEKTDKYPLFPGAKEVVWAIRDRGHNIKYIGSRKDKHHDITDWTIHKIWQLPKGELICADPQKPKNDYLSDCQFLIDDRPKTIFEFLNDVNWATWSTYIAPGEWEENDVAGRKAFALWRPYNQNLTEVKRLYLAPTWRGIRYYLERKGVI